MFKHYLITALRHFRQQKSTTAINVACLALGLACFVFAWGIYLYLTRSDSYHANADRLHILTERILLPGTDISYPTTPSAAWPLADYLKTDFPQLRVARASMDEEVAVTTEGRKTFMQVSYADAELLRLFDLPFVEGDARRALNEPRSAVVSAALAQRLFGTDKVLGRSLLINNRETAFVRGVLSSIPRPSHMSVDQSSASLYFEALVSMDIHEALRAGSLPPQVVQARYGLLTGHLNYYTYALLPADGSLSATTFNRQLAAFADRHIATGKVRAEFTARPIADIPKLGLDLFTGTDQTGVSSTSLLLLLGALVLLVSCLNYANLEAAQADTRVKETVLRRIVGAGRHQVLIQHLVEAGLLTSLALLVALFAVAIVAVAGGSTLRAAMRLTLLGTPMFWLVLVVLAAGVSLLTSSYPALLLNRVRPAQRLRSKRSRTGSRIVAALLVGSQFTAASFLLITVFVMYNQNAALKSAGIGFSNDPIVMIANDTKSVDVDLELLRSELSRQPHVQSITASATPPWSLNGNSFGSVTTSADSSATPRPVVQQSVDHDFFATLDIKPLAGRVFDRALDAGSDSSSQLVVIDAELASQIGAATPADAIDKVLYVPASPDGSRPPGPARVIGVAESKPLSLLGLGTTATLYQLNTNAAKTPLIRISRTDVGAGLAEIDAAWERVAPNVALKRRFLDEQFEQNYQIFQWVTNAFAGLATFAFVIAAMGLVGMAIHVASRRSHEIGVRKTLGARTSQIIAMLLKDFCRPVMIANLISWPLAYFAIQAYLSVFVHRVPLSLLPFASSLAVVLSIACASVASRAIRAARMNPATVLRHE